MRLWSLHPKYLDPQGLVALWREALLAQSVLRGDTRGYRSHPQLTRFIAQPSALDAIGAYLVAVHLEAARRGYSFDRAKIERPTAHPPIAVSSGQLRYEWQHLLRKLSVRSPGRQEACASIATPECHPLFSLRHGPIEPWERERT